MHYREIARRALELELVQTRGQTPEATFNAQIGVEIARRRDRGEAPRFLRYPRGLVALASPQALGLAADIERENAKVREKLHERLLEMPPAEFEALIGRLLVALGFQDVVVTARSGDGGIDVRGTLVVGDVIRTRMAVQAKRWRNNVQAPVVQQVRGSLGAHDQGLIITTSDFSRGAREEAERPNAVPVGLMSGLQLLALLIEHEIGVRRTPHFLIEMAEADPEDSEIAGLPPPNTDDEVPSHAAPRPRRTLATNRMSAVVRGDELVVEFADGSRRTWTLKAHGDKSALRLVRAEAIVFARQHSATPGQVNAVLKALTTAGYHLSR